MGDDTKKLKSEKVTQQKGTKRCNPNSSLNDVDYLLKITDYSQIRYYRRANKLCYKDFYWLASQYFVTDGTTNSAVAWTYKGSWWVDAEDTQTRGWTPT